MPQGSDPRRQPDQQSPESGQPTPPQWWGALWQELLPPEHHKLGPKRALRETVAEWAGRMALGAVPVTLASAVVVRSLGFTVIGDVLGGVALGLLVVFAAEPLWHWSRRRAASWWR